MTQAQGPFAQLPYSLWTFPGLSIYERWLAATIIRLCWRPGPQPFSYQRLAKESGLTPGALCTKGEGEKEREGMIPHLEREGLVKVYRPVNAEGQVIRGKAFLIEPTEKLWQINATLPQSVYPVNSLQQKEGVCSMGETVYKENTPVYPVNTVLSPVNTPVYDVNTEEGVTQGQKCDEKPPIYIDSIDKNIDSLVASASAESDGGISFLSQFEDTLKEVQNGQTPLDVSRSPEGYSQEEPVMKPAGTSLEPANASHKHDTIPDAKALQEIPDEKPLFPTAQSLPSNKTDEKGNSKLSGKKDTRSPEERTRCQKWQAFFNARRGGELLQGKGPRINESECIISLVQKFTDEQITAIDGFVLAEIFPHKLPANKHKVGARIVLDESQNAREVLKDRLKWPGQVIVPVEETKIVGWTPVRQIYPPKGVTVIYG